MIFKKEILNLDKLGNKEFVIFDYYDGIKGECNLEEGIILFWYDYEEDGELWFVIKTNKNLIKKFLRNKITALDIFRDRKSKIYLYERSYDDYENLKLIKALSKEELKKYELPEEGSYLGYDFEDAYLKEMEKIEEIEYYAFYNTDVSRIDFENYYPPKKIKENEQLNQDMLLAA